MAIGACTVSLLLAATPAGAYRCVFTLTTTVNAGAGANTVTISGSNFAPNAVTTLSSPCFDPVTITTSPTGTFTTVVTVKAGIAPGTTCAVTVNSSETCNSFVLPTQSTPTTVPPGTPTTAEVLGNTETPAPEATAVAPTPTGPTAPPSESSGGKLPFTGVEVAGLASAGLLMVGGGAVLVGAVRRRQPA